MVNKIKCLVCGDELESKSVHDFRMCCCDNQSFVDGGHEYQRVGGVDLTKISVWSNTEGKFINSFQSFKEAVIDSNE